MKLKDIPREELELMSYDAIAYKLLEESNKNMKLTDMFMKICELLGLGEDAFEDQVADFFEMLATDKRFVMLDKGYFDLRTRKSEKIVIDDDDDEYDYDYSDEDSMEDEIEDDDSSIYEDVDDAENNDTTDDDLKDFVVVSDEEEEN